MKKILPILILISLCLVCLVCFAACSKYNSHYSAFLLITSNTSKSASIRFTSLNGTKVFKLKSDGVLNYSAKLIGGSATVFYDYNGTKMELFSIGAGQEVGPASVNVTPGTVYVIVETNGKCEEGQFSFDVE